MQLPTFVHTPHSFFPKVIFQVDGVDTASETSDDHDETTTTTNNDDPQDEDKSENDDISQYKVDEDDTFNNLDDSQDENGDEDNSEGDSDDDESNESVYDTDDEVDNEPIRAVLIPSTENLGELDVDTSDTIEAPTSLPLCISLNARSVYNKESNLKTFLGGIGACVATISESWERPRYNLSKLLDSPILSCVSYCRGRDDASWAVRGPKVGGGAAILYNNRRFKASEPEVGVPEGVEAAWVVLTPVKLDSNLQRVLRICVGSIYISPKSKYKDETITHIIHTIHAVRAKFNHQVHFYISGDFNKVSVTQVLRSYGALQQVCSVPTRKNATLELILTDLHPFYHPPTCLPPLKVDSDKKGKDSDHGVLVWAPKASARFKVEREKVNIKCRPLPESQVNAFCYEFTRYKWNDVLESKDPNKKVELFHKYLRKCWTNTFLRKMCPSAI